MPGRNKCLCIGTLGTFEVIHKIAFGPAENKISGNELAAVIVHLYEHLIKILQLLCIAIGLYGNVVVGDRSEQTVTPGEPATQLQVERRVYRQVLRIAKGNTP